MRISDWSSDVCSSDLGHLELDLLGRLDIDAAARQVRGGNASAPHVDARSIGDIRCGFMFDQAAAILGGDDDAPFVRHRSGSGNEDKPHRTNLYPHAVNDRKSVV